MLVQLKQQFKQWLQKPVKDEFAGLSLHQHKILFVSGVEKEQQWQFQTNYEEACNGEHQWSEILRKKLPQWLNKGANLSIVLPPNKYQIIQIDRPQVQDDELADAITWAVKDLVSSIDLSDLVCDYFESPVKLSMQNGKLNVVATSRALLLPIIELCDQQQIQLQGIVPEELTMQHLIEPQDDAAILISQQLGEEPSLQVIKQGVIYFSRRLRGFSRIHEYRQDEIEQLSETISLEIQRSMDYYESQLKQAAIKYLFISLPTEHVLTIIEQLKQVYGLTIGPLIFGRNNMSNITCGEQYFPAMGAVVESRLLAITNNESSVINE